MTTNSDGFSLSDVPPSLLDITMDAYRAYMKGVYLDALEKGLIEAQPPKTEAP